MKEQLNQASAAIAQLKEIGRSNPEAMEIITDKLIVRVCSKVPKPTRKFVEGVLDAIMPDIFFDSLKDVLEERATEIALGASGLAAE